VSVRTQRICVVTGSRAEYGLLYWIIKGLQALPEFELQLVVTGMHLSPAFGSTYRQIEADGIPIARKVETLLSSDSDVGMTKSVGLGVLGFADAFQDLTPDLVLLLGDRVEILAAAQSAYLMGLPVAHLHGGEVTRGAVDDAIRHCITKFSRYHFVSTAEAATRVRQLGEDPATIFQTGAPGLDNVNRLSLLSREALSEDIGFALDDPYVLVTYHCATAHHHEITAPPALLNALDRFPGYKALITKANSDAGGLRINAALDDYAARHPGRVHVVTSLGQLRYLSAMKHCAAVIGNSSSGLFEAPLLKRPTVNIGDRQDGRLHAASVVSCADDVEAISAAIATVLAPAFQPILGSTVSLYGDGRSSDAVLTVLARLAADGPDPAPKSFYDLPSSVNE
jgi:UDP-N-acetylglucosamine 2-epimerase (non-hydrolysing)/GDP/UDP-N,N'-diacetylbacillosamine 2-epimerase (hydrolysing)